MADDAPHSMIFETAMGYCAIAWSRTGVACFRLPAASAADAERSMRRRIPDAQAGTPPAMVREAVDLASRYFQGEPADFDRIALDLGAQDAFFLRVYDAVRRLKRGEITTYGAIAKELGAGPEAARDVGQAMALNPVPLIIPCHRVLAAGGKIGGFSAPGGSATKARMLALEGVRTGPPPPAQQTFGF